MQRHENGFDLKTYLAKCQTAAINRRQIDGGLKAQMALMITTVTGYV